MVVCKIKLSIDNKVCKKNMDQVNVNSSFMCLKNDFIYIVEGCYFLFSYIHKKK